MKRIILAGIALVCACAAEADQLAWNRRREVESAVELIQKEILRRGRFSEPYYMVSYCSRCDQQHVAVWEVRKVVAVAIPGRDFFELQVFGRCVLRSAKPIREGEYKEPIEYVRPPAEDQEWFLQGVDMAYVYVPSEEGFLCLGKALRLDCEVRVERIRLPRGILGNGRK